MDDKNLTAYYILRHGQPEDGDPETQRLLIGVYSSHEEIQNAIKRLVKKPGFKDYPNDFQILTYNLNEDYPSDRFEIDD